MFEGPCLDTRSYDIHDLAPPTFQDWTTKAPAQLISAACHPRLVYVTSSEDHYTALYAPPTMLTNLGHMSYVFRKAFLAVYLPTIRWYYASFHGEFTADVCLL